MLIDKIQERWTEKYDRINIYEVSVTRVPFAVGCLVRIDFVEVKLEFHLGTATSITKS